ncbi:MAG: hypothetical protein HON32_04210 [Francisellaceae bacterium]|jgi:hypothetical protein|nr:hypothetical protein [Francisellaceae bacterium]
MKINDLNPGDIIFDLDYNGHGEHVSMFKGFLKIYDDGVSSYASRPGCEPILTIPQIIHATTGRHQSVAVTSLIGGNYKVYRCNDSDLALNALYRMSAWSKIKVPYDHRRAELAMQVQDIAALSHPRTGITEQLQYAKQRYNDNFYNIIKYACRTMQGNAPVKLDEERASSRGLRCAQAVILAFQTEEVIRDEYLIIPMESWVSDKYANVSKYEDHLRLKLGDAGFEKFEQYQRNLLRSDGIQGITQNDKNDAYEHTLTPGICFWRFDKELNPEEYFLREERVLRVDSKTASSAALDKYLQFESASPKWSCMGEFSAHDAEYTNIMKVRWREVFALLVANANQLTREESSRLSVAYSRETVIPGSPARTIEQVNCTFSTPQTENQVTKKRRCNGNNSRLPSYCTPARNDLSKKGSDSSGRGSALIARSLMTGSNCFLTQSAQVEGQVQTSAASAASVEDTLLGADEVKIDEMTENLRISRKNKKCL